MKRIAISVSACLLAVPAFADNESGQFVINPAYVYESFDEERDLGDAQGGGIGLEYRFSPHWAAELGAYYTEADYSDGLGQDGTLDLVQARLDGLFYITKGGFLQPYLGLGVGHGEFDNFGGETQFNAGGGLRFNFSDAWSARLDVRGVYSHDEAETDVMSMLGISYAFGAKKEAPPPPPVVMEETVVDSDGDGVEDGQDQCPGTPAGAPVDAMGCVVDSDGDGVTDDLDQCPGTEAGAVVDEKGCIGVSQTMTVESIDLKVQFANNSSTLSEDYMDDVARVADFMSRYPDVTVDIEGHTDSTGSAQYNKALSQKRADSVRDALVKRYGVDASRVTAVGLGEDNPIASNDTQEGRDRNRRVVAHIQKEVLK